jgi:hypothetical protein
MSIDWTLSKGEPTAMSASIDQPITEPIVFIAFTDDVNAEALVHAYLDSIEAAGKLEQTVYRVFDFRSATSSYASIFSNLLALAQGLAGAAVTPTIAAAFVGQPHMAEFFAGQQVTFFQDINDAVTHVCALSAAAA